MDKKEEEFIMQHHLCLPVVMSPDEQDIRKAAYNLWKDKGQPEGQDEEIWLEIEKKLRWDYAFGSKQGRIIHHSDVATALSQYYDELGDRPGTAWE